MEKLKLGLIGCGNMMSAHASVVNKVDTVEIVAVCDIIPERAEEVAKALGNNPYITVDYTTMVDQVDAVLVALPHHLHFECGMFFAYHKKHILMEKPLCNTEEECEWLIRRCEENNVTLMCGYPVRFWPGIVKLKEEIDSGKYGKVIQMSVWTEQLTGLGTDLFAQPSWGYTAGMLGGGQLFSHGCHYIDLLLWFLGNPVSGAHLGTNSGTPWMMREGTSALVMKFESGALAYHGGTWGARGTRLGYDFQIQTEKGMLEYDHQNGMVRLYNGAKIHQPGVIENQNYQVLWQREGEKTKHTEFEIAHFAECVRTGKKPLTDGRTTLQSLRVIWALYDAEKHGVVADLRGLGIKEQ